VNFRMTTLDLKTDPVTKHRCKYKDILKYRKDPEGKQTLTLELTKGTLTLEFAKKAAGKPELHDLCSKVFTNLTKLDQQSVRDELAAIAAQMPCEPGRELTISFGSKNNPYAKEDYPSIPHNYIVNRIDFKGCVEDMPNLCSFPVAITSWDSLSTIIDHKDVMHAFKRCLVALNEEAAKQEPKVPSP